MKRWVFPMILLALLGLLSILQRARNRDYYEQQFRARFEVVDTPPEDYSINCRDAFPTCNTSAKKTYKYKGRIQSEMGLLTNLTSFHNGHVEYFNYECSPCLDEVVFAVTSVSEFVKERQQQATVACNGCEPKWPVPSEIGLLTQLTSLELDDLASGPLPTQLGNLKSLAMLDLTYNRCLNTTIPSFLLEQLAPSLEYLDISYGTFRGTVPTQIGLLTQLTTLRGIYTMPRLTHWFVTELGQLTNLQTLLLGDSEGYSDNLRTGTIPSEIGQMTSLTSLTAPNMRLHGTLPSQLRKLTRLDSLELTYNNHLTGVAQFILESPLTESPLTYYSTVPK